MLHIIHYIPELYIRKILVRTRIEVANYNMTKLALFCLTIQTKWTLSQKWESKPLSFQTRVDGSKFPARPMTDKGC